MVWYQSDEKFKELSSLDLVFVRIWPIEALESHGFNIQEHKPQGRKMENVAGVLVKDVTAKLGRSSRAQAEM